MDANIRSDNYRTTHFPRMLLQFSILARRWRKTPSNACLTFHHSLSFNAWLLDFTFTNVISAIWMLDVSMFEVSPLEALKLGSILRMKVIRMRNIKLLSVDYHSSLMPACAPFKVKVLRAKPMPKPLYFCPDCHGNG